MTGGLPPERRRSGHLGDLVAALIDGELDHDTRDRALAHLARCGRCQDEVQQHRSLKARLLGLDEPGLPFDLARRLVEVPDRPTPGRARRPRLRRALQPPRPGLRRRRRQMLRSASGTLVGAGAAGVALLGAAFVVGGAGQSAPAPAPAVAPQVDSYVVQHAATAGGLPLADPAQGVVETIIVSRR